MFSLSRIKRKTPAWFVVALIAGQISVGVVPVRTAWAQPIVTPDDARTHGLESLRRAITVAGAIGQPLVLNATARVPLPDNLRAFLNPKNKNARRVAAQLGKALFWEMAIGSDGQACASCHFHGGADNRHKNQLSPDLLRILNNREGDIRGFHFAGGAEDLVFQLVDPTGDRGPNYTLLAPDFPFVTDIGNGDNVGQVGGVVFPAAGNTNDVASSMGNFFTDFESVLQSNLFNPNALGSAGIRDKGTPVQDEANFLVAAPGGAFGGQVNVRRVEPRNTPTVINAVFNLHNFWDGRANFNFNGVSPFGRTDRDAKIFVRGSQKGDLATRQVSMKFASLASQAVGPPLSKFEMSFTGRIWPIVGKKAVGRQALATQQVHTQDSLLATLRHASGVGLTKTYSELIQEAFNPNLWDSDKLITFPGATITTFQANNFVQTLGEPQIWNASTVLGLVKSGALDPEKVFTQMEANFSFFFGVATMLYEAELVSDQSPFDQWMETGVFNAGFGEAELRGLNLFVDKGRCVNCHGGPEFTNASVRNGQAGANLIEPMFMGDRRAAIYDNGFYNIGVTPAVEDIGRGGKGPEAKPLSSVRQLLFAANGINGPINFPIIGLPIKDLVPGNCLESVTDPVTLVTTCTKQELFALDELNGVEQQILVCIDLNMDGVCDLNDDIRINRVAVDGAFKTSGLRNVELTGPYFHNGAFKTLKEVVEFYDRGGNFCRSNFADLDPDIEFIGFTSEAKDDLVRFLISLTDERVRFRKSPFDHPELRVPNGHPEGEFSTLGDPDFADKQAQDVVRSIAAVGKNGAGSALTSFHTNLGLADGLVGHLTAGAVLSDDTQDGAPRCNRPNPPTP